MGEPAEITVVFGDGAVPGTRTFVKPFSQIDARAHGLAAGASPTASISGSDTTPILSLGIPKGDKGDTGPTGPRGPQGIKGDKGEPGGSEDAIADYFRRAASRPMQALAELGVPRPATSRPNSSGSKTGELIKDTSTGITYMWDGARWRKWDTPDWANAPIERGQNISSISIQYKLTAGQCQLLGNVNPNTGISGNWAFARITDPDLYEAPNFVPLTIWGDKPVSGLFKPGTGQLSLNTTSGLWGAYFSAVFSVKLR